MLPVFMPRTEWHRLLLAVRLGLWVARILCSNRARPSGDSIAPWVNTLMAMRSEVIRGISRDLKYVVLHLAHVTRPPDAPGARQP